MRSACSATSSDASGPVRRRERSGPLPPGTGALAAPLVMRPVAAHCHVGLGGLHGRTGIREKALEHLTTATTMYREMGMTYWLEQGVNRPG